MRKSLYGLFMVLPFVGLGVGFYIASIQSAPSAETQPVASDDVAETPRETNQRGEKQAWLCANQLGGELFRLHTSSNFQPKGLAAFCLLRTLQGAGNETEERIKALENKCLEAGGKYVGQTHKLDVLCDLSGVK